MSQLISCLLLVPVLADAGWAPNAAAAPPASVVSSFPGATVTVSSSPSVSPGLRTATHEPRQLPPPTRAVSVQRRTDEPTSSGRTFTTVVGSLAVVLCVFFVVAWVTRKAVPQRLQPLPPEVVECLGRAPLAGRQQLQLMRLGKRLILISVTATDARTLCEVTDPTEVDRLAGLCQQVRPESLTASFRQVLAQCAVEPVSRGALAAVGAGGAGRSPRSDARVPLRERGV